MDRRSLLLAEVVTRSVQLGDLVVREILVEYSLVDWVNVHSGRLSHVADLGM